jgi:O-phosphoseryl-tRNA(Cys) synthetase
MRRMMLVSMLVVSTCVIGCGDDKPQTKAVAVQPMGTAIDQAKTLLDRYAKGQMVGSEVTSFGTMIADAKAADAAKGAIVEEALNEIKKNPSKAAAKAKEALGKL